MSKFQRTVLAAQTVEIQMRGTYNTQSGRVVSIREAQEAAVKNAQLYLPNDYDSLTQCLAETPSPGHDTRTTLQSASTLDAGKELRTRFANVACLNFASAKNPGGGFLSGAQAQEESLARVSGLYTTLTRFQTDFYDFHQTQRNLLYSDRTIFSPNVPVFGTDEGVWLEEPWTVSFLTCAAANVGALQKNDPAKLPLVRRVMLQRTRFVLAVAAAQQIEALVLGAWGCGVFRNDPEVIAWLFAEVLAEPNLQGRFAEVVFAIYNPKGGDDRNYAAFERVFGSR